MSGQPRRVVLVVALVAAVVVGVVVVIASRRDTQNLRVVEAGFSEVREADGLTSGSEDDGDDGDGDDGQPGISWAVVIENATADRAARGVTLRIELLDESGDVVEEVTSVVEVLPPRHLTAITGFTDEQPSAVADIRTDIERTDGWQRADDDATIEVDDLEVAYSAENQPIVTFTATSRFETAIRERDVHTIYRDRAGHILGGSTSRSIAAVDPPLEPGEPVPVTAVAGFTVPDLATVEVYVEPTTPT